MGQAMTEDIVARMVWQGDGGGWRAEGGRRGGEGERGRRGRRRHREKERIMR